MDLQFHLEALKATRNNTRKILSNFSYEELNRIPEGFNNNLIWNYGHMIITQQRLCYKLANVDMFIDKDLVKKYAKGTHPDGPANQDEYKMLQELDYESIQKLEKDYNDKVFKNYKSYTTSYGVTLNSIENAIPFNNIHEGHHFGNILSMRKLL